MTLTDLEAVREHMQLADDDETQDELIDALIPAVSALVTEYADREFVDSGAGETRQFYYDGRGLLNLSPYDAQAVSTVRFVDESAAIDASTWGVWPLPAKHGVVSHLTMPRQSRRRAVEVAGTWGWESVPDAVERATIIAVIYMLRTSSQWVSDEFDIAAGLQGARMALPGATRALIEPYKRHAVGV
jgi:hypothetical protein